MPRFRFSLLLTACLIPFLAIANPVHEYTLKNGLKLFVKEDHRAPIVISEVWYKVGAAYEPDGITGISHALEHMMFRGTKKYGPGVIERIVSENGGQSNAFTSYDYTGYYELFSADKLHISFDIESDRMRNLLLEKNTFSKEIQVVMEERRMRVEDNPQARTQERFFAAALVSNPYHHMPIGWLNDLQNMHINDLRQWYKTWYAPNNAILVVVGDVKPEHVYQLAKRYFGPLKSEKIPQMKPRKELEPLGERTVTVSAPAKLPWIIMGYNTPVLKTAKEKWKPYALIMAAAILDGSDSSRLPKGLVRGTQIASSVGADYDIYMAHDSLFTLSGTPAQGHTIQELKAALLKQVNTLQVSLVTQTELDRIKAQVTANKVYAKDSISAQAMEIGSLESAGLSWRDGENFLKHIESVTPQQIQAVAKEYLTPDRLTIGLLKPLPIKTHSPQSQAVKSGEQHVN